MSEQSAYEKAVEFIENRDFTGLLNLRRSLEGDSEALSVFDAAYREYVRSIRDTQHQQDIEDNIEE